MTTAAEDLRQILADPHASRLERDAASLALDMVRFGLPPQRHALDILKGYVARRVSFSQDRYGK
jgi:hypothetical protein